MIEQFTKAWFANLDATKAAFSEKHPKDYKEIVSTVVTMLHGSIEDYKRPDPERIHQIDDGDYKGTLVFVIGSTGYQPDKYWYVKVSYGSCSGCDTLEGIRSYGFDKPTTEQSEQYTTLALHILQGLREMGSEIV